MAMAHKPLSAVVCREVAMGRNTVGDFGFNGLGKQCAGAGAQRLAFSGLAVSATFALFLGDLVTAPITYVDNPTLLTDIAAAIKTLPGVNADDVLTELRSSNPLTDRKSVV